MLATIGRDMVVRSQVVLFIFYFGLLLLLRGLSRGFDSLVHISVPLFVLGGMVGMTASLFDRLIYLYYSHPDEPLSLEIKQLIKEKKFTQALAVLHAKRHTQRYLTLNNALFLGVWVLLAFFLLTSSVNVFARGLVFGVGLNLIHQIVIDWQHKEVLNHRLFWPIKRRVNNEEMKYLLFAFMGMFGIFSYLVTF